MDAFLRRVIEQREREQADAVTDKPASQFGRSCRTCGVRLKGDDKPSARVRHHCSGCGGARADARFEREKKEA